MTEGQEQKPEIKQEIIRNEKGQFAEGHSGNPTGEGAGRPKGSISITEQIKKKLEEIPPNEKKTYLEALVLKILKKAMVDEDQQMIKTIWNYVDGMPKQNILLGLDEIIGEIKIEIKKPKDENSGTPIDDSLPKELGGISKEGKTDRPEHRGDGIKQDSIAGPTDGDDHAEGKERPNNDSEKNIPGA